MNCGPCAVAPLLLPLRSVPWPLPLCPKPLLPLLPLLTTVGLWLCLPGSMTAGVANYFPLTPRGWVGPSSGWLKLCFSHSCVDQILVSAFPPPFQAMNSKNLLWLSQSGHLCLFSHTCLAWNMKAWSWGDLLTAHTLACLGGCVMSYKWQPCASCPGMHSCSPSFQPPIWPPGHPTLLCKL